MSNNYFLQANGPDYSMGSVNPAYDQPQGHRPGHMAFSEPPPNIHALINDRIQRLETQQAVDKALAEQSSRRLEEKLDKLVSIIQDRPPSQAAVAPPARERKDLVIPQATPPLDKGDYTSIRFWEEGKWNEYRKTRKPSKTAFLQGEDGSYTGGTRLKHINVVAKQLWTELYAHRQDPQCWGQAADTAALFFNRTMTARFIEFQLCDETGWKVRAYATAVFPDWNRGPRASGNLRRNDPSVISHVVYETSSRGHEYKPESSRRHREKDRKRKSLRKDEVDEPRKKRRHESPEDTDRRRKGKEKEVVEVVDDSGEDEGVGHKMTPDCSPPTTPKTPAQQSPSIRQHSPLAPSRTSSLERHESPPPASPAASTSFTPPPDSPASSGRRVPTPGPELELELEVDQHAKSKNTAPRKSGRNGLNHLFKVNVPKTTVPIPQPPPTVTPAGSSTLTAAKASSKKDLMVTNDSNSLQNLYAKFLLENNPLLTKAEFKVAFAGLPEEDPEKYAELQSLAKAQRASAKASKKKPTA